MAQTPAQSAALKHLWREAQAPDRTHYPDEDTVTFTRHECREIWARILSDSRRTATR